MRLKAKPLNVFYLDRLNKLGWADNAGFYLPVIDTVSNNRRVSNPRVSVIVVSWRYNEGVSQALASLNCQKPFPYEVIFVNNGGAEEEFSSLMPFIDTYIRLTENTGAYLSRNIGALFSNAPILLFLDDDALAEVNLLQAHAGAYERYDVIAVRGVVSPRTANELNSLAGHYYLGEAPFPIYADIEGNTSYDAESFFKAGGWDAEIRFGGGGVDLSRRLLEIEPDLRKQIYLPEAVIYHDYAQDEAHLKQKHEKQGKSRERLRQKHPDYDVFLSVWEPLKNRADMLIQRPH